MREAKNIEFKRLATDSFSKTVSANANYCAGRIFLGIDNGGEEVDVSDPAEAALNIENKINDSITPRPQFSLEVSEKTGVATLKVEEGRHKPYSFFGRKLAREATRRETFQCANRKRLCRSQWSGKGNPLSSQLTVTCPINNLGEKQRFASTSTTPRRRASASSWTNGTPCSSTPCSPRTTSARSSCS